MQDITTREDLELLLRDFYGRAFADPLLRQVFVDVVRMDLEQHLPVIVEFWRKVLFNAGTYNGRTMEVHRRVHQCIPLTQAHFTRWLELWQDAIAANFTGPVAAQAASQAARMASGFLRNLSAPRRVLRPLPIVPLEEGCPVRTSASPSTGATGVSTSET